MKYFVNRLSRKFAHIFSKIENRTVDKTTYDYRHHQRVLEWVAVNGDSTLRLNYELDENSIVLDCGGFEGQWASDIFAKYTPTIHVFEPVQEYAAKIEKRFAKNSKISVFRYGLGDVEKELSISITGDTSSVLKEGTQSENIKIIPFSNHFKSNDFDQIDLLKINIEGAEYELLTHIIDTGSIDKINNIQVQFHEFFDGAKESMEGIQKRLSETHELTYSFPFVWENWKRKIPNEKP